MMKYGRWRTDDEERTRMLSTLSRSFGNLLPILVLSVLLLASLAVFLLHRSRRRAGRRRPLTRSLLDVALPSWALVVLYLTVLVPIPLGDRAARTLDLTPAETVNLFLAPSTTGWAQALGNLVLLVPLGAMIPLRFAAFRTTGQVAAVVFLISLVIELLQLVFPLGRVTSVDDLLLNTAGGTVGALLTRRWWPARKLHALESADPGIPPSAR